MQQLSMIEAIPGGNLEGAVDFVNQLKWNIRVAESGDTLSVGGGHKLLLKTSSREAVDAFLYGLALAYSVLPKPILDQFRKYGEDAVS